MRAFLKNKRVGVYNSEIKRTNNVCACCDVTFCKNILTFSHNNNNYWRGMRQLLHMNISTTEKQPKMLLVIHSILHLVFKSKEDTSSSSSLGLVDNYRVTETFFF